MLAPWKKSYDQHRLHIKSIPITLLTEVYLVKAMVFPVVMYGCEKWTITKAACWKIDAFELWCWRTLLRVPWTTRRANQSILKEISPNIHWKDWCWIWNSNTLATWREELIHLKRPWYWEILKAGREGDDRGWDICMASLTQWILVSLIKKWNCKTCYNMDEPWRHYSKWNRPDKKKRATAVFQLH